MMRIRLGLALLAAALVASLSLAAFAQDFDTKAKFAVLMDYDTGTILYDKAADERLEPASMAKLMTLAVVFTYLQQNKLHLDDQFFISEHAWREGGAASGGSTMFAILNSKVRVEDLLKSVIVQSGNDAAIALAEGIGGDEVTFAKIENKLAQQIGLTGSHFTNATGLPDPDQYSTAHDLATLSRYIIKSFPEYLSAVLDAGVHLEQDPPDEPQFAARARPRRRRPQDRPHRGSRLWRGGLGSQRRAPADRGAPRPDLDERTR